MSFQSLEFLVFLAAAVAITQLLGRDARHAPAARTACLTLCSLFFYWRGCESPAGWVPVLLSLGVTWAALPALRPGRQRRGWILALAAAWHIAVLAYFKYAAGPAPLGLSFFTFQQLWLLKEVYTGGFPPDGETRAGLLLYAFFFPTVTSGPILKPQAFFPQLGAPEANGEDFAAGLYALSRGFAKKLLLADPLGTVVANGWSLGEALTAPAAWTVILGYTLQLYLDFSGYCDIASGCARFFGIRLPVNFDAPYRSCSVEEFWKRWHMTLTSFLRECVYFPLGGSRRGTGRTCAHILAVYLLSGLWHGTGWTFLVWGLLHGLAQIAERLPLFRRARLPAGVRWAGTFLFVNLAWVFFRAPSLAAAGMLLRCAFCGGGGLPVSDLAAGALDTETAALRTLLPAAAGAAPWLTLAALFGVGLAVSLRRRGVVQRMEDFRPTPGGAAVSAGLLAWAVLSFSSTATCIYSNF